MDRCDKFLFTLILAALCYNAASLNLMKISSHEKYAPYSRICRLCQCNEQKINCVDKNITSIFTKDEWADLGPLNVINVDLSQNLISDVTPIAELPIKVLNLSHNRIEVIENASFKDLQEMQALDLSHNSLTYAKLSPHAFEGGSSPDGFAPPAALRTLSLAYNALDFLHQDLFEHVPELTELDLSGNPLQTLDLNAWIAISSLPELRVLRLRECQLTDIPEMFFYTHIYLERLDISHNQLISIPKLLKYTKNLVFLNLNQNPIVRLEADSKDYPGFPRLKKLEELHMCHMPELTSVGAGTLAGLENLAKLHLSFNPKLSTVHAMALARSDDMGKTFFWPPIRELYLQSNHLSEVDHRLIRRWDLIEEIDVSANPYLCNCTTQWMVIELVKMVDQKEGNSSHMVCQEPLKMRGYTMKQIYEDSTMRCLDKHGNYPIEDRGFLVGALIGTAFIISLLLSLTCAGLGYVMYRKCRSRYKNRRYS